MSPLHDDPFNLWLSDVHEMREDAPESLELFSMGNFLHTRCADIICGQTCGSKISSQTGWYERALTSSSLFIFFFSFYTLRGRYPVPEVYHPSIFIRARAEVFGTLIAQLLFKFALRTSIESRSPPILFSLSPSLLLFYSINHPIYEPW